MKLKKIFIGVLTAAVLFTATPYAVHAEDIRPINANSQVMEQFQFGSFTGTVKKITDYRGIVGSKKVLVENEPKSEANFIVSVDTYILNNDEITVGSKITGYYNANMPMIMIYPSQYITDVVIVENDDYNVKVDIFDSNLVSADNSLKINITDETEIVYQNDQPFSGELANQKLVIIYDIATKSIPAQTNPIQVVVLSDEGGVTQEDSQMPIYDVSTMELVVNNEIVETAAAYTNEQGTVMVPLRAIANALNFDISWNSEQKSIMMGKDISLKIGKDNYNYTKTDSIKLGTAPTLVEGTTFVPLSFFREVAQMNNAYVFESQIVIDNEEKMK